MHLLPAIIRNITTKKMIVYRPCSTFFWLALDECVLFFVGQAPFNIFKDGTSDLQYAQNAFFSG